MATTSGEWLTVMAEFFHSLLAQPFLQYALIAGLLASIGCGVIGAYVVVKRITFIAGGIAHTVLGGMGAAVYYGFDPMAGALLAAVAAALLIGSVRLYLRAQEDTLIGALWAIGMAVGILFISRTPGYQSDLLSYLFGNILLVPEKSLWFMAALDLILLGVVTARHREILVVIFDEEFARIRGVSVPFYYLLLLTLIAVTVVLLIQVVGLILVLALITLPAASAGHFLHSLTRMMLVATLLGAIETTTGLALSYQTDAPAGPVIILLAGGVYLASALLQRLLGRYRNLRSLRRLEARHG